MKEITRRLNKLSSKSILTAAQRKRLVDSLGEHLADIAESNISNSKLFRDDNRYGRDNKVSGYITAEEREEVARILDDPSAADRMRESLEIAVMAGEPFPFALGVLTAQELTRIINESGLENSP